MTIRTMKVDFHADGRMDVMAFFTEGGHVSAAGNFDQLRAVLPALVFDALRDYCASFLDAAMAVQGPIRARLNSAR